MAFIPRFAAGLALPVFLAGAAPATDIAALFRPFQTEHAALSPDGRHLAYSERQDETLFLAIVDLETNRARKIALARDMVSPLSGDRERTPAQLTYLRWATASRLIFNLEDLVIWGVDADGGNARALVRARDLSERDTAPRSVLARRPAGPASGRSTFLGGDDNASQLAAVQRALLGEPTDPLLSDLDAEEDERDLPGSLAADQVATDDVFASRRGRSGLYSRHPTIVETPTADPGFIVVEARGRIGPLDDSDDRSSGDLATDTYKVDIHTGKFLKVDTFVSASRVLSDPKGLPRLLLAHASGQRDFLHASTRLELTRPLDRILDVKEGASFRFSPENYLGQRSIPLAFGHDPDVLYYASNAGRDSYGIYSVNLATRERTDWAVEHASLDLAEFEHPFSARSLTFDRHTGSLLGLRLTGVKEHTRWFDPELARIQATLEASLPEKSVEILEWSADRSRFLVSVSSQSDPGGFYLFERAQNRLVERVRRAPWIDERATHPATTFAFTSTEGVRLNGYLTLPRDPRRMPVPLLVYAHDGPWNRDLPGFNRGAQALASMGFAVAQVNFRGSSGFGQAHLTALRAGFDTIALQDILETIDHLTARYEIDPRLVAMLGNGYGGYLALRALQLHPDRFRSGVSMNAPTDLSAWMNQPGHADVSFRRDIRRAFVGTDPRQLANLSPLTHARTTSRPALVVHGAQNEVVPPSHALSLRRALEHSAHPPEYLELASEGHGNWLPGSYVRLFQTLEAFFNASIYRYDVQIGDVSEEES